jgi:error-prone DNA polymerase
VQYLHPALEAPLGATLGVLLFQEQVLLVTEAITGWPLGRGELLRRALAKGDADTVRQWRVAFQQDAVARGVPGGVAAQVFSQLAGFAGYSFPRSHAAAFAVIAYQSAWLKRYAPLAFYTALLNHQPMGFWAPSVLVGDAKRHGVRFLPVDLHRSADACTVEDGAIRIGLRSVTGFGDASIAALTTARATGPFRDLRDLARRTQLPKALIERLILAGACAGWGVPRRALLWQRGALRDTPGTFELPTPLPELALPALTHWEELAQESAVLGLSIGEHVLAPLRAWLRRQGICGSAELRTMADGSRVTVAGTLVIRQSPPTAKGHVFLTLEDEAGLIDIVLRPSVAARVASVIAHTQLLCVHGMLQRDGAVVSVLAWQVEPLQRP